MKSRVVVLTIAVTSMGVVFPATAQIRNPSQDFFWQGRQELEREIQVLQEAPFSLEGNLQKPQSTPLLEVHPSPTSDTNHQLNEVEILYQQSEQPETSTQKPNPVNNKGS